MDPFTMALIMGGTSLIGGFMNQSAQSSANAANIAQAQWQSTGGYLPGLVRNATAAGINPLAVLPGGGGSANIQPVTGVGTAMSDIGQNLSRAISVTSPHQERMENLQEKELEARISLDKSMAASHVASAASTVNAPGSPPPPKRSTLAWPLSIPDDLATHLRSESGIDLNSINATASGWGRSINRWMLDNGFLGSRFDPRYLDPGAGAWVN